LDRYGRLLEEGGNTNLMQSNSFGSVMADAFGLALEDLRVQRQCEGAVIGANPLKDLDDIMGRVRHWLERWGFDPNDPSVILPSAKAQ